MKIFVVIAVFNRKKYTLDCLSFLKSQTYSDFQIVIVDDGSTDGTSEEIQKKYPEVIIVKGDGNWWWTKSMNIGCNKAIELGANLLITLNNDTYFEKDFVNQLVDLHSKYPKAILGSLNLIRKESEYIFFSGLKNIVWWKAKEVKYHKAFTPYNNDLRGIHSTKCLNGRGTLIPVKIFQEIGGYDETNFPQYASDYDLTLRAQQKGYDCLISYDIKVYSFVEETGDGKSFMNQSWLAFFKSFKNPYSQTSLKMWYRYYLNNAPKGSRLIGFIFQNLRTVVAFVRKRKMLSEIN